MRSMPPIREALARFRGRGDTARRGGAGGGRGFAGETLTRRRRDGQRRRPLRLGGEENGREMGSRGGRSEWSSSWCSSQCREKQRRRGPASKEGAASSRCGASNARVVGRYREEDEAFAQSPLAEILPSQFGPPASFLKFQQLLWDFIEALNNSRKI